MGLTRQRAQMGVGNSIRHCTSGPPDRVRAGLTVNHQGGGADGSEKLGWGGENQRFVGEGGCNARTRATSQAASSAKGGDSRKCLRPKRHVVGPSPGAFIERLHAPGPSPAGSFL